MRLQFCPVSVASMVGLKFAKPGLYNQKLHYLCSSLVVGGKSLAWVRVRLNKGTKVRLHIWDGCLNLAHWPSFTDSLFSNVLKFHHWESLFPNFLYGSRSKDNHWPLKVPLSCRKLSSRGQIQQWCECEVICYYVILLVMRSRPIGALFTFQVKKGKNYALKSSVGL